MFQKILTVILCFVVCAAMCCASAEEENNAALFEQVDAQQSTAETEEASGTLCESNLISTMQNGVYCVPRSTVERSAVTEIRFVKGITDVPADAWDVSSASDGSIMAWMENSVLCIGSEGIVKAPVSCAYMFSLYRNLTSIDFNDMFDTSLVTDMSDMFSGCSKLIELDLNSWDVSKVTTMASMFEGCKNLTAIHAADWDTSSLVDTKDMFNDCPQLGFNSIEGLKVESYEALEEEATKTYTPLKKGDYNDAVKTMQNKLIKLGYSSVGKADGIYGGRTASAVHAFKKDYNIYDGGNHDESECAATALMLQALEAASETVDTDESEGSAVTVTRETTIKLAVPSENDFETTELSDNQLKMSFDLKNTSKDHAIINYTLSVYATGVWGDELYTKPMYFTFSQRIEPMTTVKSGQVIVNGRGKIANLYIGVQSVTYDDSSAVVAPEVSYTSFAAVSWL